VGLGLIGEMDLDAAQLLMEKLRHNQKKYELIDIFILQEQGYTPADSMREMKRRWDEQQNLPLA
jgi:hypothetical protein